MPVGSEGADWHRGTKSRLLESLYCIQSWKLKTASRSRRLLHSPSHDLRSYIPLEFSSITLLISFHLHSTLVNSPFSSETQQNLSTPTVQLPFLLYMSLETASPFSSKSKYLLLIFSIWWFLNYYIGEIILLEGRKGGKDGWKGTYPDTINALQTHFYWLCYSFVCLFVCLW